MPGRDQEPSFQLASGTTNERDGSYNFTTLGSVFYNTDTSNVEVYHEDPSNTVGWRDLVMNNKEQIDISGKLVVDGDVSFNADLTVVGNLYVDGSFNFGHITQNITTSNMDIGGKLVVDGDVSFNAHLSAVDASFQNNVSFNAHLSAVDASFQNDVDISGKLVVDGDVSFNGDLNLNMGFNGKEVLLAGGLGAGALNGTGGAQGIATATNTASGYSSHNAFNGTLTDVWHTDDTTLDSDNPKSLIFEFPYDVIISKYKIWPRTTQPHNPKAWTLRACPAGRYDRMYPPTRNFRGTGNSISTKTISGQAYGNGHYKVNESTMYQNSTTYAGWNAFTGIVGSGVHFAPGYYTTGSYNQVYNRYLVTGYYGDWLTIELPDPINLTKYGFKQRGSYAARAPGQYKIYGSTDGSNWTALVHKTSTITYTGVDFEESISTTGKYKHFGLVVNQLYGTGQTMLNFEEWYIYGNEDIPVEIDDVSGVTNWPTPTSNSITNDTSFNEYPVSNTTTAYRKFELNITESADASYVTIGQLAFYGYKQSGNLVFSDSTVQNTSSAVLEYISSYCDGTIISVKNPINFGGGSDGTIKPADVTGSFDTNNDYWQLITGSNISYCPPPGTTLVIYEFNFQSRPKDNHKIMSIRFILNGTELSQARQGASTLATGPGRSTFHHIKVPINVTSVNNNWSSAIDLRCEVYSYSNSYQGTIHEAAYWMSAGGGLFVKPSITLIAIKQ